MQCDDELIHLWDKAKRLVWQIDMQDYQIAHYFSKYYHLEADLKDFESPMPPAKFTVENLTDFIKDIERHTRFLRQSNNDPIILETNER